MSHSIEVVSPVSRKIIVSVPAEEVNAALSAAAKEVGAGVTLPGFRKGKAPASVIEKRLTAEVYSRASESLVNKQVEQILAQENLKPLSRLEFDGDPIARGKDLNFNFTFETLPEIALPEDLTALSVAMGSTEATPEYIAEFATNIRRRFASLEDVNEVRLPENGDIVTIDVDGEVEGKPVEGMKVREYSIQLTEPQEGKQLSELDNIIRRLHPGEEGNGSMLCPEDHPDPSLRGKTADLHVKLHKIQKQILPELNEEFAKKAGFKDVEALNKSITEQATRSKASAVRSEAEQALLDSCLEGLEFPLPEIVVKEQQEEYENELRSYLRQQGLEKDAVEESVKTMQDENRRQGEERARAFVFLAALAQREKLEVSPQEVDYQIMRMASQYGEDFRKLRDALYNNGAVASIRDRILNQKAMDLMFDKAQKVSKEASAN